MRIIEDQLKAGDFQPMGFQRIVEGLVCEFEMIARFPILGFLFRGRYRFQIEPIIEWTKPSRQTLSQV
jgi:hypothetical protein